MREIEIKYRILDREAFFALKERFLNHYEDSILSRGTIESVDHYYRTEDSSSVRIRHLVAEDIHLRTFKGKPSIDANGFKSRTEDEYQIPRPSAEELSEAYLKVHKFQEWYALPVGRLFFDAVENLGYFVELEYLVSEDLDADSPEVRFLPDLALQRLIEGFGRVEDLSYRELAALVL